MTIRLVATSVFVAIAGLLAGCGPGIGDVTGTVKYQGKAPTGSTITFYDELNGAQSDVIAADGSYTVRKVAAGKAKVAIVSPQQGIVLPGMTAAMFHSVPPKYADPAQSGLTYQVKSGAQTHNFDLAD